MKRDLRIKILKAAKQSLAIQLDKSGYELITESDILNVIKSVSGARLIPGSYQFTVPSGRVREPWGPEITFKFEFATPSDHWANTMTGNKTVISNVESAFTKTFEQLIKTVFVTYQGSSIYEVQITQQS